MIIHTARPYAFGRPHLRTARNRVAPDSMRHAQLAADLNMLAGRRMKRLFSQWVRVQDVPSVVGGRDIWFTRFHTSKNVLDVRVRMLSMPATYRAGATSYHHQWTVGGVAQPALYQSAVTTSVPPPGSIMVDDYSLRQTPGGVTGDPLAGDTTYEASLFISRDARPIGCTLYEVVRPDLDSAVHLAVPYDVLGVGAEIFGRDHGDFVDTAWALHKRQGAQHVSWSVHDGVAKAQTGTTYANVLDGSTAAYALGSVAGFHTHPRGRGRLVQGRSVLLGVFGSTNTGSSGRCRFEDDSGTIGTITGIGTTEQWYTTEVEWNNTAAAFTRIAVAISDAAGNTMNAKAAVMYDYMT